MDEVAMSEAAMPPRDHTSDTSPIRAYLVRPLDLGLRHGSLSLVVLVTLVLARLSDQLQLVRAQLQGGGAIAVLPPGWVFELGTGIVAGLLERWPLWLVGLALFAAQCCGNVALACDLVRIVRGRRGALRTVLRSLRREQLVGYCLFALAANVAYFGLGALAGLLGLALWRGGGPDLGPLVLAMLLVLLPLLFACLSIGCTLAALPLDWPARMAALGRQTAPRRLARIATFFGFRLALESGLLVILPLGLALFFTDNFLIVGLTTLALTFPFTVLRGSTFAFFLRCYRDDHLVAPLFHLQPAALPARERARAAA
jgi:hypothetical protein